jgi:hypothetical protein
MNWEGVGIILALLYGVHYFRERMNRAEALVQSLIGGRKDQYLIRALGPMEAHSIAEGYWKKVFESKGLSQ